MAPKPVSKPTPTTATKAAPAPVKAAEGEKKERKRRPAPSRTYTPKEVYQACMAEQKANGTVNKASLAEKLEMTAGALLMTVLDFCANQGVIPPKFAMRTSGLPGTVRARYQGKKEHDSPAITLGANILRAIGVTKASAGSIFKVETDNNLRSITLTWAADEPVPEGEDSEEDSE